MTVDSWFDSFGGSGINYPSAGNLLAVSARGAPFLKWSSVYEALLEGRDKRRLFLATVSVPKFVNTLPFII